MTKSAMEQNRHTSGLWLLLALLLLFASSGCAETAESLETGSLTTGEQGMSQDTPPTGTAEVIKVDLNAIEPDLVLRSSARACRELYGPLLQTVESADPAREAQALGLNVRQDQVQVTLVLDGPDSAFLERTGIATGKQDGARVQAYVPISRLCELATQERVLAIYPASLAETP